MFVLSRMYVWYPRFLYLCGLGKKKWEFPLPNENSNLLSLRRKIFKQIPLWSLPPLLANTIITLPLEKISVHVIRVWILSFKMRSETLSYFYWGGQISKHICVKKINQTRSHVLNLNTHIFVIFSFASGELKLDFASCSSLRSM